MSVFLHMPAIADLFWFFSLEQPLKHPLVAVVDFSQVDEQVEDNTQISADFYCLLFKNYNRNNVRYGRKVVDFNNGSLICMAPNQVIEMEKESDETVVLEGRGAIRSNNPEAEKPEEFRGAFSDILIIFDK